jgi:acyl-CoA thioesterase
VGGGGRYTLDIPYGWEGAPGVPYGGWTAAVALRAAGLEAQRRRPASVAAQFLRPLSLERPLDIDVDVLRRGRRTETIRVSVGQAGKLGVHALVTTAEPAEGLEFEPEVRPAPPAKDALPTLGQVIREQGGDVNDGHHIAHYDYRVPPDRDTRGGRSADGRQALVGWIRYGPDVAYDDPFVEGARFLVPADTQVPAAFLRAGTLGMRDERLMRGTTLDLLVHLHRTERSTPWLWYETHVQIAHGGLASGICNLWSDDGHLLATSFSQVAFLAAPLRT